MVWLKKKLEEAKQSLIASGGENELRKSVQVLLPTLRGAGQPGELLPPVARAALADHNAL